MRISQLLLLAPGAVVEYDSGDGRVWYLVARLVDDVVLRSDDGHLAYVDYAYFKGGK